MYREFYKLKELPFNITADPDFFYSSQRHAEAFSHLSYGIKERKGIIVISGEIGTGKTILCRTLLNHLDEHVKTALILNPSFSDLQLLQLVLKDLGIPMKDKMNKFSMIDALNEYLINESIQGNNVVLIIDEAQNLGIRQLEQVRLLSNLETEKQKLLQIVLIGQPELLEKLKLPELRQLNQRVTVRYHMMPLDPHELKNYIHHRLNRARKNPQEPHNIYFTEEAIEAIYDISGGTPRMVNILCDRALLAGFVAETKHINKEIIFQCAREVAQR
ncbi:MAG: AAA family ATPase [Candidatus Omnitrophica bacterium]|nr:AAA family ATPase [Candidatus Omnitrophota bacterium]